MDIIGNLGADAEMRETPNGTAIASCRVAVSRRVKRKGEWQEHTEWVRVALFGRRAEGLAPHLVKGTAVYASGPVEARAWQPKDGGDPRASLEMVANEFELLGSGRGQHGEERRQQRPGNSQRRQGGESGHSQHREARAGQGVGDEFGDDEMPF